MYDRTHIKAAFGKAASTYDDQAELQALIRADAITLASQHWPENAYIADIGCGTGAFAHETQQQGLRLNTISVDIAFGMCQQAHTITPHVINASADALPFADASFDGLFSSLMLQWMPDTLATFREMARITKPHARLILTSFTEGTLKELQEVFASIDTTPHINTFLAPMHLTALAAHAGFALLDAREETFTEYYSDAISLMRSIKTIGASNKNTTRAKGLMTPSYLKKVETYYAEHFGKKKKGLPATWNAITLLLERQP